MKILLITFLMVSLCLGFVEYKSETITIFKSYFFLNMNSKTKGVIFRSSLIKRGRGTKAPRMGYMIRYKYFISDREYIGSLVNYKSVTINPSGVLDKYPVGASVTVFYDSSAPHHAVLEKTSIGFDFWLHLFVIIICVPLMTVFLLKYVFVDYSKI